MFPQNANSLYAMSHKLQRFPSSTDLISWIYCVIKMFQSWERSTAQRSFSALKFLIQKSDLRAKLSTLSPLRIISGEWMIRSTRQFPICEYTIKVQQICTNASRAFREWVRAFDRNSTHRIQWPDVWFIAYFSKRFSWQMSSECCQVCAGDARAISPNQLLLSIEGSMSFINSCLTFNSIKTKFQFGSRQK